MIEANGHIKDGKLFIHYRNLFDEMLGSLPDCPVKINVERVFKRRSNEQNSYYWGVVVQMVYNGLIDAGWEITNKDQAHEIIKDLFFISEIANKKTGELMSIKTTTKSSTFEFMTKLAEIQKWASEYLGISIPDPNEQTTLL